MVKSRLAHSLLVVIAVVFSVLFVAFNNPQAANAVNPTTVNFQGKVVNANGTNVTNGTYTFVFNLYSVSSGGSSLWTETDSITVTNGVFQVNLGSGCSFFVSNACNNNTPIDFSTASSLYLGMTFNSDPNGEMSPRMQFQSVPFAFNADKVGGLAVSQLVQLSPGAQQTGFINVSGTINGATISGGTISGGTLTGTAVNSLNVSGTAISGTGALSVTAGGTAQNITINGTTTGKVQIGATSTGDIELGGGSGGSGCTLTNSNGNFLCDGTINGATLSGGTISGGTLTGTAVNSLNVSGTAISGTGALSVTAGGSGQNLTLNGTNAGKVIIAGTSTGDVEIGGGFGSTGCSITTAGAASCDDAITATGGFSSGSNSTAGTLVLNDGTGTGDTVTVNTPNLTAAYSLTLPSTGPAVSQCLKTDSVTASQLLFGDCAAFAQKVSQTFNTYSINQAANATTAQGFLVPTTATAFSIALAGTTEVRAASSGSFRACTLMSSAAVTAGTVSVVFRKNGANVTGTSRCTLNNTTRTRTNAEEVLSGVETFAAGDTIGIALVSSGLTPATLEHWASFAIEYGAGGSGPTTMQDVYSNGNMIVSSDARDLQFTLSDTATDSNFLIDIATGSTSKFAIQNNGTDMFSIDSTGALVNTGTINGATLTGGTLSATAVNSLLVSGTAIAGTGALTVDANAANTISIGSVSTGDILFGGGSGSTGCTLTNASGDFACTGTINGATLSGGTLSSGNISGGTLTATAVNSLNVGANAISTVSGALTLDANGANTISLGATSTGDILLGGGSASTGCTVTNASGNFACTGTLNGASISAGTLSGGTFSGGSVTGGTLTATAVNSLNVSGTAISGTGSLTIDGTGAGTVSLGATSTGDILFGGGSGSTGCTVTNASGNFACTGTINGATLSGGTFSGGTISGGTLTASAVNSLNVSGTAISGTGALSLDASGANILSVGSISTGDILLGGGSASTGCTVTNTSGNFACTGTLNGATISGGTLSGGTFSGGSVTGGALTATTVNSLNVSGTAISGTGVLTVDANGANNLSLGSISSGDILFGGGSGSTGCTVTNASGNFACTGTINGATLSGGTISGGTLTATAVNTLNVSGTAITGTGSLTIDGTGAGTVSIGATSTGNILLAGGSGATGCTVTNATGVFACTSTINGATISGGTLSGGTVSGGTLTGTAVNSLNVSGTAISGTGALTIDANGANTISIGATSTGDILLGGGSASTGCTVTNSTGDFACTGNILASNQGVEFTASNTNPACAAGDYRVYADLSETAIKKCVNGTVSDVQTPDIRSFIDTTSDAVVDANTTSYWDNAAENNNSRPNITPSATDKEIFGIVSAEIQSSSTADVEVTARVEASTSATQTCNTGTSVGGQIGTLSTNTNAVKSSTTNFLYEPGSTTKQYFNICSDANTVGTAANVTRIRVTLYEVDNSNADLAEVYPSSDITLKAGELVSLDSSIANGVKRSNGRYDRSLMGVVSTSPALVIGGQGDSGNTGVPVALSGRVPVKVSTENGVIKAGDKLAASSIPGVAMKSTKAGQIIGMAMESYSGSEVGSVMTFVQSGHSGGDNLSTVMGATNSDSNTGNASKDALDYLMSNKPDVTNSLDLSEIFTDRLAAGLEIITPKITANEINVEDLAVFKNDVHIEGTLYANKIKANQIEGLEIFTDKISSLEARLDTESQVASNSETQQSTSTNNSPASNAVNTTSDIKVVDTAGNVVATIGNTGSASFTGNLSASNMTLGGGLAVGSDLSVGGLSTFQKLAIFVGKVIFRQDVQFDGHIAVGSDSAGYALLKQGENKVSVKFTRPYEAVPVVSVNTLDDQYVLASVSNVTKEGFDISVKDPVSNPTRFSWTAVGSNNPITAENPVLSQ